MGSDLERPASDRPDDSGERVQAIANAIIVLRCFSSSNPSLTISQASRLSGLSRGTARRVLITLLDLGLVGFDGQSYFPTAGLLSLGYAYLSSLPYWDLAQPHLISLEHDLNESCSIATLDFPDIVYVARVMPRRSMTLTLSVGSRLPAFATSMGRVLLAGLADPELFSLVASLPLTPLTTRTITRLDRLISELHKVRRQGFAIVDGEREEGVRSAGAPIRSRDGRVIAAVNVSTNAGRVSLKDLRDRCVPRLLMAATAISADLLHV